MIPWIIHIGNMKDFMETLHRGLVFFKDGRIHLKETRAKLETNLGKRRMKLILIVNSIAMVDFHFCN